LSDLSEFSEFFKNIALFGYFEGGKRMPTPRVVCLRAGHPRCLRPGPLNLFKRWRRP
jgi:hypothetical protein